MALRENQGVERLGARAVLKVVRRIADWNYQVGGVKCCHGLSYLSNEGAATRPGGAASALEDSGEGAR